MVETDLALMAHLLRRAGFGADRKTIDTYAATGYEQTVKELLDPEGQPGVDVDEMRRYYPSYLNRETIEDNAGEWIFRMINEPRQLREKMALFWHTMLCTGYSKVEGPRQMGLHIDMFREHGMGNFRDLLLLLSCDPTMIYYLDNCENNKRAVNENYGRELLELFSMGVGMEGSPNYSEDDVKACARAFTGWNIAPTLPVFPYGRSTWEFRYNPGEHDESEKTFLGETGNWNGEDVVGIICKQPSTARFLSRKLYDFFVADEPPVPFWQGTPPRDPTAIEILEKAYFDSGYEIKSMLRALFNSAFFKSQAVRFAKVKSPAELVAGAIRVVGEHRDYKPGQIELGFECKYMGMELMNPPSVEGWHTGREWIDSGSLVERINFVSGLLGDPELPGVRDIIRRLGDRPAALSPEELVDGCLDLLGPIEVFEDTRAQLLELAEEDAAIELSPGSEDTRFDNRVARILQMIGATAEFQMC